MHAHLSSTAGLQAWYDPLEHIRVEFSCFVAMAAAFELDFAVMIVNLMGGS